MELKEGYKKTDVGIIPNEWNPKTYGELFHFLTTSSFSRDELSEEGEVRCVHYGDIHTKYHQFIDFNNDFKSFIDAENGKKYPFIKDGDIIMADASEDYSGIGKSVEVKNLGDKPAISGLHTFLLRDKNSDFVDGFRAYIHSMIPVKKSFDRLATGLKVYGVSKGNLKTVLVPVPPKAEQHAIATALSEVDTLISKLDKLIAKKKDIKQGAMQRLLKSPAQGGQRLPYFEGEWKLKTLDELVFFKNGSAHEQSIAEFGDFIVVNSKFISTEGEVRKYSKEQICPVEEGDILMVMSDVPNGRAIAKCFYVDNSKRYTLNQRICAFTTKGSDSRFLFHLINRNEHFLSYDDGVKQTNLRKDDILSCPLLIPETVEEQNQISTIIDDMIKEIESLETKKSKYLHTKQGIMQELLTGKTRLV